MGFPHGLMRNGLMDGTKCQQSERKGNILPCKKDDVLDFWQCTPDPAIALCMVVPSPPPCSRVLEL